VRTAVPARFTYWLKKPVQSLKLEVLDSQGRIVRSFDGALPRAGRGERGGSGATEPSAAQARESGRQSGQTGQPGQAPADQAGRAGQAGRGGAEGEAPADEEEGGGRGNRPQTASMAPGVQRFSWDLQSEPVVSFPGMVLWGATQSGPLVLPGTYQVRLTVNGRPLPPESFTVKKHPYHDVSDDDLRAQYEFASQIRDKVNEANNAIIQIRRIKQQLAERVSKTSNADVKAIAEELTKQLTAVEEDVYQVRNQSNQDPLNFPIKTNNRLASLLRVVLAGEGRPTSNTGPIFEDLKAELKGETDRLQRALATYLPRFNQAAQRAGLQPVTEK
jgi:hypothetical protein